MCLSMNPPPSLCFLILVVHVVCLTHISKSVYLSSSVLSSRKRHTPVLMGKPLWLLVVLLVHCEVNSTPRDIKTIDELRLKWENNCLQSSSTDVTSAGDTTGKMRIRDGCVVYYLHNHKSGGTTMCHTALKSGYHITNLDDNCNLPMDIVTMDRRHRKQGISQHYVLNHPNLSFVAQELPPFYPNISNDKYIYVTTIRHPIDRVISHIHHGICTERTLANAQKFLYNGNCSIRDAQSMTLSELVLDECFDKDLMWLSSNYYVSMFSGCIVNKKKLDVIGHENACSQKHLQIAINKLHFFSVIMITDTVDDYFRFDNYYYGV